MSAAPPRARPVSLRWRLTGRLAALQIATLALFAALAAVPLSRFGSEPVLDFRPTVTAMGHLAVQDGELRLDPPDVLADVFAAHPGFWVHIRDAAGRGLTLGTPPGDIAVLFDNLTAIVWADFVLPGEAGHPLAQVRRGDSPVGRVWVVTGGGPTLRPFSFGLMVLNWYFIAIAALMTLGTVLAIPLIVRRALAGLTAAAAEASRIDVDQRGTRLSGDGLPTEILDLVQAVNTALSRLDDGFARRQRFLADAAHELRTPIAVLATRVQLLPAGTDRDRLALDVARLSTLADQLLDLQRLDHDQPRLTRCDLAALAAEVAGDLAPLAIAAGCEIALDAPPHPVWVMADRHGLIRVLSNLVQNAITHGAGSGIEVSVEATRAGPAVLRVRDGGPGVPVAVRERLFEPFVRAGAPGSGTGLGLDLSRKVVTQMGGSIHVADAPGGGADFIVRLPLAGAPA